MEHIRTTVEFAGVALELIGVAVIAFGAVLTAGRAFSELFHQVNKHDVYLAFRQRLGKGILLGLEFLVAGDIINTVAVEPTLTSVGVLAIIVIIRTFLSFTLEVEMTGRWPWQSPPEEKYKP